MSQEVEESTSDLASKAFASHAALFPLPEFAALSSSVQSDNKHTVETELPNHLRSSQFEQREEYQCAKEVRNLEFTTHKELLTIEEYDKNDDAASAICALVIAYRWYTCAELAHEMALPTVILEEAIRHNDSSFLLQHRLLWWLRCHVNIAHKIPLLLRRSLQTSVHNSSNYGQVYKERSILAKSVTPEVSTAIAEHKIKRNEHKFKIDNTEKNLMANDRTSATNLELVKMQDVSVDESFYNALNVTSREHYTILESTVGQNFISILNNTTNNVPALRSVSLSQNGTSDVWGSWITNKLSSVLDIVNGAAVSGNINNSNNNYYYSNSKNERGITKWSNSYNTSLIDVLRNVQNSQSTESSSTLLQQYELPVDFTNYIHLVASAYYVNRKENEEKYIHKKRWQQEQQQQQQQQFQTEHFAEHHLALESERQKNESVHEHISSMVNATEVIDNNFILPWPKDVPKEYYKATFDVRDEINNLFSNSSDDVENGKTFEKQESSNEHFSSPEILHKKNDNYNNDIREKNNQTKQSTTNNLSQEEATESRQSNAAKIKIKTHEALTEEKQTTNSSQAPNFTDSENVRRMNTSSIKTSKITTSDESQGAVCVHRPLAVTNAHEVHHSTEAHQNNSAFMSINNFASDNDLLETRDSVLRGWCDRVQECLFIHVQHKSNDFFTISNTYRHLGEDVSAALHQVHFARITQLAERTRFVNDILATAALYRRRNNLLNVYHVLTSAKRVTNQLNKLENWIRLPERELEELPQYVTLLLSLERYIIKKTESFNANDANDADKQTSVTGQNEQNNLEQIEPYKLMEDATTPTQHGSIMRKDTTISTIEEYDWSTLSHLKWVSKFPERLTLARHALEQLIRAELIQLLLTLSTETTNNAMKYRNNMGKIKKAEHSDDEHTNNKMFVSRHVEINAKTETALSGSTGVQNSHDDAEENSTQVNSYEHAASLSYEALRLNILSDALEGFTISAMHSLWTRVKESVTSNLISSEELNDVQANDLLAAGTTSSQPTIDEKRTLLRFCSALRFAVFMQLFQEVNEVLLQEVELVVQRWGYYVLQSLSPALNERKSEHDAIIRSESMHLFHVICTEAESITALMIEVRSETLQSRREMELLLRRGYRVTRELLQPVHQLQLILPNMIDKIECELRVGKAMQLTGCKIVKTFVKQYHAAHLSELSVILESEVWSAVEVIPAKYQRQISKLCEISCNTLTYRHYDHDRKGNTFTEDDNNTNRDSSNISVGDNSNDTNSNESTIANAIMHFRRRCFDNYFVLPSCESLSNINEDYDTHSYSYQSRDKSNNNITTNTTYVNKSGVIDEDDDDDDDEDDSRNENSIKSNNNNNSTFVESAHSNHARSKSEIVIPTTTAPTTSDKIRHREREFEDVIAKSNKLYISLLDDSGDGRVIAHSVFYVIKLLVEYERHLAHFPSLAYDLILRQSEVLEKYDQLTAYLILGANAIEKGTLKTITATHLCVASQCMALLAELTERMQQRLTILECASRSENDQTALVESSSSHVCDVEKRVDTIHQQHVTILTKEEKNCLEEKVIKNVNSTTADNKTKTTPPNSNKQSNTIANDNGAGSNIEHNGKVKCKNSTNCSNQNSCSSAEVNKLRTFIEQSFSRVVYNLYAHRNDCFHKIAVLVETKVDSLGNIDSGQEWKIRGNEWVMTMLREVARLMRTLRPLLPQRDINGVLVPLLCSLTMKIRESTRSIAPTDTDAVNASRSDVLLFKANVERFGYDVLSCAAVPSVKAAMSTNNYAPRSSEDEVLKWFFPSLVSKPAAQTANTAGTEKKTVQTTASASPASQNKT